MSVFSNLRRVWRGHGEKLDERAYHDGVTKEELRDERLEPDAGLVPLASPWAEPKPAKDALEHEKPR